MSMVRWEPFKDLMTLREAMDRLFEDSMVRPGPRWTATEARCELLLDVYTTGEELVIVASVPGLKPEDVEITIEGETLTIRGTTPGPLENVEYVIQERRAGAFSRALTLNVPVKAEGAEAVFENGVLTLTIPKAEEVRPKVIKVQSREQQ